MIFLKYRITEHNNIYFLIKIGTAFLEKKVFQFFFHNLITLIQIFFIFNLLGSFILHQCQLLAKILTKISAGATHAYLSCYAFP